MKVVVLVVVGRVVSPPQLSCMDELDLERGRVVVLGNHTVLALSGGWEDAEMEPLLWMWQRMQSRPYGSMLV